MGKRFLNPYKSKLLTKFIFIIINIFSSGILFTRSILFLRFMSDRDLGVIMLFQSVIALFGFAQIGLFNGGLRIFSIDNEKAQFKDVNNTNVTYIAGVTSLLVIFSTISSLFIKFNLVLILFAILTGGGALLNNWFSNILIARKELKAINFLNIISTLVSLSLSFTILIWNTVGALLSISSLYIVFISVFLIKHKNYRPTSFSINFKILKKLLSYGLIPYLSGIVVLLNNQIDRFLISERISLEALGKFYLAVTFVTIFDLFPNNLNSLFSPSAINNYSNENFKDVIRTTKLFFLILILYSFCASLLLILFGDIVILKIFPDKINQLKYLLIMLPGIIAITLSKPLSFILYVALNLRAILWSNIFSLFSYLSILILFLILAIFTVENVAYGKAIQGILVLIILSIQTFVNWGKIKNYFFIKKSKYESS